MHSNSLSSTIRKTVALKGTNEGRVHYLVSKLSVVSWPQELWSTSRLFPSDLEPSKSKTPKRRGTEWKHTYIYFNIQISPSQTVVYQSLVVHILLESRGKVYAGVWVKLPEHREREEKPSISSRDLYFWNLNIPLVWLPFPRNGVHYRKNKTEISRPKLHHQLYYLLTSWLGANHPTS